MVKPWLTVGVIAFGIIVAIVGVVAYFRMYKNSVWTEKQHERNEPSAPSFFSPEEEAAAGDESTNTDKN